MGIAKWIVAFVALYGFGGVLADFVVPFTARMHMKNPHWPPHAKFHNGQTMLMGVFAGTLSLFCLFAVHPLTRPWFFAGAAAASLYWVALAFAQLFPGTAWIDPEFAAEVSHPLGLDPQQLLGYFLCLLLLLAVALALLVR
jgi:hypothetical protein